MQNVIEGMLCFWIKALLASNLQLANFQAHSKFLQFFGGSAPNSVESILPRLQNLEHTGLEG
jgi:hypothetical protein